MSPPPSLNGWQLKLQHFSSSTSRMPSSVATRQPHLEARHM
eukprot:CAMPEP_0178426602 /NCGR_PEP_ID=MMETSP0689_2-20121128/29318_1 /TAXON_ID=160604 /ORGANISM="Amphidinium massartii, Strain CS-259" /LENGTH=40 /DNA_ID= /DNA_START= /DNA_END= /DNA_ORIENTATION=